MELRLTKLREHVRASLWIVPAAFLIVAFVLAQALLYLDREYGWETDNPLTAGDIDSARTVLSTIATATLTVVGVVFSVTMLVLQTASRQLSPRVMRTFLRDAQTQLMLGAFLATFVFSIVVLRQASEGQGNDANYVPRISESVAILLTLVTIGMFVQYIDHIAHAIRPSTVLSRVASEAQKAIDNLYPEVLSGEPEIEVPPPFGTPVEIIPSPGPSGVVISVHQQSLERLAKENDVVIKLLPMVGDFVAEGSPLAEVYGGTLDGADLGAIVEIDNERSMAQDAAFGFRQLVDIAERALSPGITDPTTAIQALDQLHAMLHNLATRRIPSPVRLDDDGNLRLVLPRPGWDDYVNLALDEIRHKGSDSIQVVRRIRFLLDDVEAIAPPERRHVLRRQRALVDAGINNNFTTPEDREAARRPGRQGHGPAPME